MFLSRLAFAAILALVETSAVAGDRSFGPMQSSPIQLAGTTVIIGGSDGVNSRQRNIDEDDKHEHGYQPRNYCIIDSDRFCRTDALRVGGVCRCSGMTGSGRVVVR